MNYKEALKQILEYSGWSQELLAAKLEVSFPALNAWLNDRATPRAKAQTRIQNLLIQTIGTAEVSDKDIALKKRQVCNYPLSAQQITADRELLDILTLYLTYHTNTIEGSTMTLADVENVIFDNKVLSNRTAIEQLEAKNHQAALYWLLDSVAKARSKFLVTEEVILGIHLRLMNGIVSDAGQYRKHSVRIMGAHVPLANWQKIPALLANLTNTAPTDTTDIVRSIAEFHAQFEKIHPFSDGNGRTGRLLMLAQALTAGIAPPIVPKERKHAYYKYLELAQTKDMSKPLELFVAESILFAGELLKT